METIETFKPVYQAFIDSNLSIKKFCKEQGIPESRFYYWQEKIRAEAASQSSGGFLPVSINNHSGKVLLVGGRGAQRAVQGQVQPACEIVYPNGVTVRLSGDVPASTLGQLIMLGR